MAVLTLKLTPELFDDLHGIKHTVFIADRYKSQHHIIK
jgi:hypothetical protein